MHFNRRNQLPAGRRTAVLAAAQLPVVLLQVGCAAGSYGRLDMSSEVLRDFTAGIILPAHRYYTSGGENTPIAIIGVSEDFTLVTERWKERTMSPDLLRKLVRSMAAEYGTIEAGLVGSTIVNDQGERIGVWYSSESTSTVEILGGKKVRVNPPVLKEDIPSPLLRRR
jgi:hypothetical protein